VKAGGRLVGSRAVQVAELPPLNTLHVGQLFHLLITEVPQICPDVPSCLHLYHLLHNQPAASRKTHLWPAPGV
jgi:hypothetical protein